MHSVQQDITTVKSEFAKIGVTTSAVDKTLGRLRSNIKLSLADWSDFDRLCSDLPSMNDREYGALLLEQEAMRSIGDDRKFLLQKALERAQFFAACCTSSGEGSSRAQHMKRIQEHIKHP